MYIAMLEHSEQKKIVQALKGREWIRGTHGCLYDRGSADSYYGRPPKPHYGGSGGEFGFKETPVTDPAAVAEYMAGYNDNEDAGSFKDYR
jgi:hypothetical protein